MTVMSFLIWSLPHFLVRARALTLGGGDEEVVTLHGEGAGVPVGGDEGEGRRGGGATDQCRWVQAGCVEYRNRVARGVGHEQPFAVSNLGEGAGPSCGNIL